MEGLQIATYNNRVIEIVPDYRLKETSDGTITITKDSVEQATYAPFSENDQTEGMYIQNYSINEEGHPEKEWYEQNLLVAIVDLNYRFLTPINPESDNPDSPENKRTSYIISENGCVEIDNKDNTINRGDTYTARLTTKEGFARLPKGRIEMQVGNDGGEDDWVIKDSWSNSKTLFDINIPNVIGNLRFVFEEECVYNLTIKRTLNGQPWPDCPIRETEVIEKHCSDVIDTDSEEIKKPITNYLINSVTPSEITTCANTTITVDYKPANSDITIYWHDDEKDEYVGEPARLTLAFGEELPINQHANDKSLPHYHVDTILTEPTGIDKIVGDGQPHTIVYHLVLDTFTVTYIGDDHVTIERGPVTVKYGQDAPDRTFTITGDYNVSESHTGTATVTKDDENNTISVTNVQSNVVVTLSSAENIRVTSITADQIDAMGGVKLTAHLSNDTEDSNPEHFSINSYQIGTEAKVEDVNQSNISQVYDYVVKDLVDKKVISNLEWPNTSSSTRNVLLGVTYNQYGSAEDEISTTQRAETYGYYEGGLKSNSNSSDLKTVDATTSNWKANYLVDFGDSSSMYGDTGPTEQNPDKVKIGLDIYNKDITPYYIPGTDIGENPLINITSDNVTYVQSGKVVSNIDNFKAKLDFNKPENNDHNYEHYHILWQEQSKGKIFTRDLLTSEISYCGLYDEDCGCSPKSKVSKVSEIYTLEAGLKSDTGAIMQIQKTPGVLYKVYYKDPSHNYGRDSISYYHTQLEKYAAKVDEEIFKDSNKQPLNFSYPVHINSASDNYGNIPEKSNFDISWDNNYLNDYYKFSSVRWESAITNSILTPDNNIYNQYYDYNNRIDLLGNYNNKNNKTININKYNLGYYTGGADFNSLSVGDSYNSSDIGREVTVYYTMMSPENQVRPTNPTENVYKFIKLDGIYNGADYSHDYNYGLNLIELENISNYTSEENKNNHVTYISSNYKNKDGVYEPLNDSQKYLYNKHEDYSTVRELGKNKDYSYKCENKGYTSINAPITENVENGIYYPYRLYNLSTGIQIRQYYNDPSETETHSSEADHYLHNGDMTKYVACTEGFNSANYYIYYPKDENDEDDLLEWWITNLPNVTKIENVGYESGSYIYNVSVTINRVTTIYKCKSRTVSSISLECFYELTYEIAPIYTNADSVTVEFLGGCNEEGNKCGVGSFKMKINGNEYPLNGPDSESWLVPPAALTVGDLSGNSEIRIIANTRSLDLINNMIDKDRREFIKEHYDLYCAGMFTGGGRFKVTAEWTNTEAEVIDTRILIIDISGTCKRKNAPNKEGCTMPWEYLVKYYKYYNGSRYDNTRGDTMLDWIGPEESTNNQQAS